MCTVCIIDEETNYLITVPIYQAKSEEIGEALIENVITKYCIPEYIVMGQDSAFMSSLMTHLLNKFNITIRTVALYNCQSLQAEHGIKSLSTILTKHLTNLGQMWSNYLYPDIKVSGTFKEYYQLLNMRLKYLHDILLSFKSNRLAMINKDRAFFQY